MSSTARGGSLHEQVRSTMGTESRSDPGIPLVTRAATNGRPGMAGARVSRPFGRPGISREGSFGLVCLSPFVGRPSDTASVRAAVTD
jgi:hypothetical protein